MYNHPGIISWIGSEVHVHSKLEVRGYSDELGLHALKMHFVMHAIGVKLEEKTASALD